MDYQGNYFPEEHDENESKIYKTVKGIFKWTMYGISFVIYGIIIFLIFINRDSKILEKNYLHTIESVNVQDTDEIEIYRINTPIFMNEDGSLQIHNVDYVEEYGIIEIGIKHNAKKLTDSEYDDTLEYLLQDSNGNTYSIVNVETDRGGRYAFARVCFQNINLSLDSNDLRFNNKLYGAAKPAVLNVNTEIVRDKTKYTLSIYRKKDNELIYTFDLYNNSVTFQHVEYND